MQEQFYTIGEFAEINKITTRMLRHYDKVGLLKPACIAENGYRLYSSEQIAVTGQIKKYRDYSFSLNEIQDLIKATEDEISRIIQYKIKILSNQQNQNDKIIESLCRLTGYTETNYENFYEISYTEYPERIFACSIAFDCEADIEAKFDELFDRLQKKHMIHRGLSCLIYAVDKSSSYRAAVPIVKNFISRDDDSYICLNKGWYLSTFHYGDYYSLAKAYEKLKIYAKENGLNLLSPFIERYFVDRMRSGNPLEYITEVSIKFTP